jgi:glyoxylase-like metal-dependent hydrolase (beta-lactamase superfamily II)
MPEALRIKMDFVNAYLVDVDRNFLLFDTGLKSERQTLLSALAAAGCHRGNLKLVILSHADPDHAGNAAYLHDEWGARIAIHAADAPFLAGAEPPVRLARNRKAAFRIFFQGFFKGARKRALEPMQANVLLKDRQALCGFGLCGQVLHFPGHSPGSLALVLPEGDLFCGDLFDNHSAPGLSPFYYDEAAYRSSLERAKSIAKGWRTIHPGHGDPFPADKVMSMEF